MPHKKKKTPLPPDSPLVRKIQGFQQSQEAQRPTWTGPDPVAEVDRRFRALHKPRPGQRGWFPTVAEPGQAGVFPEDQGLRVPDDPRTRPNTERLLEGPPKSDVPTGIIPPPVPFMGDFAREQLGEEGFRGYAEYTVPEGEMELPTTLFPEAEGEHVEHEMLPLTLFPEEAAEGEEAVVSTIARINEGNTPANSAMYDAFAETPLGKLLGMQSTAFKMQAQYDNTMLKLANLELSRGQQKQVEAVYASVQQRKALGYNALSDGIRGYAEDSGAPVPAQHTLQRLVDTDEGMRSLVNLHSIALEITSLGTEDVSVLMKNPVFRTLLEEEGVEHVGDGVFVRKDDWRVDENGVKHRIVVANGMNDFQSQLVSQTKEAYDTMISAAIALKSPFGHHTKQFAERNADLYGTSILETTARVNKLLSPGATTDAGRPITGPEQERYLVTSALRRLVEMGPEHPSFTSLREELIMYADNMDIGIENISGELGYVLIDDPYHRAPGGGAMRGDKYLEKVKGENPVYAQMGEWDQGYEKQFRIALEAERLKAITIDQVFASGNDIIIHYDDASSQILPGKGMDNMAMSLMKDTTSQWSSPSARQSFVDFFNNSEGEFQNQPGEALMAWFSQANKNDVANLMAPMMAKQKMLLEEAGGAPQGPAGATGGAEPPVDPAEQAYQTERGRLEKILGPLGKRLSEQASGFEKKTGALAAVNPFDHEPEPPPEIPEHLGEKVFQDDPEWIKKVSERFISLGLGYAPTDPKQFLVQVFLAENRGQRVLDATDAPESIRKVYAAYKRQHLGRTPATEEKRSVPWHILGKKGK